MAQASGFRLLSKYINIFSKMAFIFTFIYVSMDSYRNDILKTTSSFVGIYSEGYGADTTCP